MDFKAEVNGLRGQIKSMCAYTKGLVDDIKQISDDELEDKGEMIANLMLAYRHMEDARMRLGKALQAHDGGVSIYDQPTTAQEVIDAENNAESI